MSVVIETTIGDIIVDLYVKERPNTCLNFLKLCKVKFYNLCAFYKIEKNFIAQTGDPTATGRGGESIFCQLYGDQAKYFDAEFKPRLKHEKVGTLSMVNNGNNMNGSQFFLTLSENLTYLDENHSVFGEVAEGFDILLKLNDAICDNNNRPYQDIRITHTVILHDPFEDPEGLSIPDASPEPTREMLESDYIGADEEIDDTKGKTAEEIEEKIKESEAKARATILEMVGDIPDAEVKPPENVLFVCKLNPVTTSEDLEVIFSRFGKILSCEVIKDKKTGESLQYAFIEFEREEDCEAAYFKMDHVLIDDRRIHVDFSQSVSKLYFNRNNLSNKKQPTSNLMLKNSDKNDGYNLIFDDENYDAVNSSSHKSKSNESASKHKNSGYKRKHSSSCDDYEVRRNTRVEREEYNHSYKFKDSKSYRYDSKEKYRSSEKQGGGREKYSRESETNTSYRLKEDKYNHDKNKKPKHNISEKYEDDDYSYSSKRNSDYKFKSRYSSEDLNRSDRDSKNYRKSSHDSRIREHKVSHEKIKEKSLSPIPSKKSFKNKDHSSKYSSHKKHFNRSDSEDYVTDNKKSRTKRKNISEETIKSVPHKQKKDKIKKHHSSKKAKSKTSRSVSVSSSCSTSSSSSSSSSSTSSSSSSSSSYNNMSDLSDSKHKKHHEKNKKYVSSKKKKSPKKNRY